MSSGSTIITNISSGAVLSTTTVNPYTSGKDGMAFDMLAKARYSLDIVDLGLLFAGNFSGVSLYSSAGDTDPTVRSASTIEFDAGAALKFGGLSLPVEADVELAGYADKDSGGTDTDNYFTLILKAGAEYKLSRELSARLGFSFTTANHTWNNGGTAGPNPGEDGNPVRSGIGIHAGAGYDMNGMVFDAVFAIKLLGRSPLGTNVTSYGETELLASAGAKIPL
jgi:hypothetical protein